MTENKSIEDFIKNYLNTKKVSLDKKSYDSWLSESGIDSAGILSDSVRSINSDYKRALSEFGSGAQNIHSLGLGRSGYSDYLKGKAYSQMQKGLESAKDTYINNEKENKSSYQAYLESVSEKEEKLKKELQNRYYDIVDDMTKQNLLEYDAAYNYALNMGLDKEGADMAARLANTTVRHNIIEEIKGDILKRGLDQKMTIYYALARGLTEQEAQELGYYADKINSSFRLDDKYPSETETSK